MLFAILTMDIYGDIISNVVLFYPILFIPLESIYLRQCIEDKGCELLYMYRKSVLFDIGFILLLYFCILIPPFCIYAMFIGSEIVWLIIKIIAISIFFHAITYMMSYITGSIIISAGMCLLICLNAICNVIRPINFILYYKSYIDPEGIFNDSILLLFWSVIFYIIGKKINRNYNKYI